MQKINIAMTEEISQRCPEAYPKIDAATQASGFTMPSDPLTCALLRTLAAAKPGGRFLELGTGTGLATAWILDGMDDKATLISFDYDPALLAIARRFLEKDQRLTLIEADGETWVKANAGQRFDYIFADTWHGKYLLLNEVLAMLNRGGIYVVDDMLPQPNWPEGHARKAADFVTYLESRNDLLLSRLHWATGVIIVVKK